MNWRKSGFTLSLVLFSCIGHSQDTTATKNKQLIAEYIGGREGYSGLTLELYSDSSYSYSSWLDNGMSFSDSGTYQRIDSSIILHEGNNSSKKHGDKLKGNIHRIRKNSILMYTEKEEKKDRDFYKEYYTLYLYTGK